MDPKTSTRQLGVYANELRDVSNSLDEIATAIAYLADEMRTGLMTVARLLQDGGLD